MMRARNEHATDSAEKIVQDLRL